MRIINAPVLAELTTIRLGGPAIALLIVEGEADLERLAFELKRLGGRPFMMGRGSNLIAADDALPITLVGLSPHVSPALLGEEDGIAHVHVSAGCPLPKLISWCARRGLSGLEGLAGIPGQVGGALRMNAGSFGTSFTDVVTQVQLYSPRLGCRTLTRDAIQPSYRHTTFPGDSDDTLILSARLKLACSDPSICRDKVKAHLLRKASVQPVHAHSAGCAFANPPGQSAGKLLDAAGFKGKSLGGMAFSEKHANFLVNLGHGTSSQAMELLHIAQETIMQRFGISLSLEVKILP